MWRGKLIVLDMTPLGWLGRKTSTQTNKQKPYCGSLLAYPNFSYLPWRHIFSWCISVLTLVLLILDMSYLCKQPSDLDLHCHYVCEIISKTWIKKSYWLKIWNGCCILIYSAWQGLTVVWVNIKDPGHTTSVCLYLSFCYCALVFNL